MESVLHPALKSFVNDGFFTGIENYTQLKNKISELENTKLEGDAFEIFVEAYLKVIKRIQKVIPAPCFDKKIKKKYHYPVNMPDCGVDGLYLAHNNQWVAYQAKFRSHQKNLTWTELSTFIGAAKNTPASHVFTTCRGIVNCVDEMFAHDGTFFSTKEEEFEKLTKDDFKLILNFIQGKPVKEKPLALRGYQKEASSKIVEALETADKTQAIMACGTGKTLVMMDAFKSLYKKDNVNHVVIFVPTLILLKQTYDEIIKHSFDSSVRYLAVCSQEKIKENEDSLGMDASDLDYPATTNPEVYSEQRKGAEKSLTIATYQSAEVLQKSEEKFDIGFFDEAHRTVGKNYKRSAIPLFDENILISKRVFLTATPKHYPRRSADYVAMDDPSIYGERCFTYSFSQAEKDGWVTPLKIVISCISSDEVNRDLLNRSATQVESEDVRATHVATQLGLAKVVEKFNVKKIISYHRNCSTAREFICDSEEGISSHISDIDCYHVNGEQSMGDRSRSLREFENSKLAIVSNAKCLTEGVDIPAVDCVAFIQPKHSPVDIVQAVGRPMRPYKGKEYGYLYIPIFVQTEDGETVDEAIQKTDFSQVFAVARAMRENDDTLDFLLEATGREEGRRQPKGSLNRVVEDYFEFVGENTDLNILKQAIETRVVEQLVSDWDFRYGQLELFYEKYGHANVPYDNVEFEGLSRWVISQRQVGRNGNMSKDRLDKLSKLNFTFNTVEAKWWNMYYELKKMVDENNWDVNSLHKELNPSIRLTCKKIKKLKRCKSSINAILRLKRIVDWVEHQKVNYRKKAPFLFDCPQKIKALEDLGINWSYRSDVITERHLDVIKKCGGPSKIPATKRSTYKFISIIREGYKNGGKKPKSHKHHELVDIRNWDYIISELEKYPDWTPNPLEEAWEDSFNECLSFKRNNRYWPNEASLHVNNLKEEFGENFRTLPSWMNAQIDYLNGKVKYASNTLSEDRIKKLKDAGFPTDYPKINGEYLTRGTARKYRALQENIRLLQIYYAEHGRITMPRSEKKSNVCPGGSFLMKLRKDIKDGRITLTKEQENSLKKIGAILEPRKGNKPVLHVMEAEVDYTREYSNGSPRVEKYTSYRIHLRKKWGVGEKPVVISYSCEASARKACKFLQEKVDSNCKETTLELRDLVYKRVPQSKSAKTKKKK